MSKAEQSRRAHLRRKTEGACDKRSGVVLTANPEKAGAIRDPNTGQLHRRGTPVFEKLRNRDAAG